MIVLFKIRSGRRIDFGFGKNCSVTSVCGRVPKVDTPVLKPLYVHLMSNSKVEKVNTSSLNSKLSFSAKPRVLKFAKLASTLSRCFKNESSLHYSLTIHPNEDSIHHSNQRGFLQQETVSSLLFLPKHKA